MELVLLYKPCSSQGVAPKTAKNENIRTIQPL